MFCYQDNNGLICQNAFMFKFFSLLENKETNGKNYPDKRGHYQHSGLDSKYRVFHVKSLISFLFTSF